MNEIININFEKQMVSARELHKALEVEKRFSVWFETNSQGFVEGEDYSNPYLKVRVQNEGNREVKREVEDYEISMDMAKHICLMSRTEKGKQCRQYLIDLEKAWNTPEQVFARALKMADQAIDKLKSENHVLVEKIEQDKPKTVFADAVAASKTSILVGELAKIIKQNGIDIGQNRFFKWMRDNGYLVKRRGTDYNMPTQKSMEMGLFEIKERVINNPDGSVRITKTALVSGKGQQYFISKFLAPEEAVCF
jgi:anti-repressor protein